MWFLSLHPAALTVIRKKLVLRGGNLHSSSYLLSVLCPNLSKQNLACCSFLWDILHECFMKECNFFYFLSDFNPFLYQTALFFQGLLNYIILNMSLKCTYAHLQLPCLFTQLLINHWCGSGKNAPTLSGKSTMCMSDQTLFVYAVIYKRM